jgi:hypothetical protein
MKKSFAMRDQWMDEKNLEWMNGRVQECKKEGSIQVSV